MTTSELVGVAGGIGVVNVESSGPFGYLMRRIVGIPLSGNVHHAELDIAPIIGGGETWTRRFGDRSRFSRSVCSRLQARDANTITERFGAVTLTFDVGEGLEFAGPRLKLKATTIWRIRFGRRWLAVDVFVGPCKGTEAGASDVRARVLGGRVGKLDYSVVMTPTSAMEALAGQTNGAR